jgi:hypothetical protein
VNAAPARERDLAAAATGLRRSTSFSLARSEPAS